PGEQRPVGPEATVVADRVGAQLARDAGGETAFGDIERALILRYQDAVGPGGVEDDPGDRVGTILLRIQAVDRTVVELLLLRLVDVAVVPGIGEPDASLAIDREVVR